MNISKLNGASQHDEKGLSEELSGAPDSLVDFHTARDDQHRRVDADAALERPEQLPLVGLRAEVDLGVRGELRPGERGLDGLAAGAAVREQDLRANRSSSSTAIIRVMHRAAPPWPSPRTRRAPRPLRD